MSIEHNFKWPCHPNIYHSFSERELNIYFTEPDGGVNDETGIVLLISGFGGNTQSKVYKKMRNQFSDKYNLICVQCDYFGNEFMQTEKNSKLNMSKDELQKIFTTQELTYIFDNGFNQRRFYEIATTKKNTIKFKEILNESTENFNEMGILQALDNLTALFYVIGILQDNNYKFNAGKIIVYGNSHGSYLGYLCNAFVSNLFTLMIDNSSWLFPEYLKNPRFLSIQYDYMHVIVEFEYLTSKLNLDEKILTLPFLYQNIDNTCNIQCFHGETDALINHNLKESFCKIVDNCTLNLITKKNLDGSIFKSTNHGLEADFLKLFDFVYTKTKFKNKYELDFTPNTFKTSKFLYQLSTNSRVPTLNILPVNTLD